MAGLLDVNEEELAKQRALQLLANTSPIDSILHPNGATNLYAQPRENKLTGALSDTLGMYDKGISQYISPGLSEGSGLTGTAKMLDNVSYGQYPTAEGLQDAGMLALNFAGSPIVKGGISGLKALRNFGFKY